MKLFPLVAALSAALLTVPASAQDPSPSDKAKTEKSADKKICKTIPRTGSNIRDKFCLTRAEWKKVDEYVNE